jgi:hypothetical protein
MEHYLIRIIKYYWNPLTKSVEHKAVASKSISSPNNLDVNAVKRVLNLLSKELTTQKGDSQR